MRALERGAREKPVDARGLQSAGVCAVQPVDLAPDIVDQGRPVEAPFLAGPAEPASVGKFATIAAAIDEQLLRHAAADHAGAADAILLGDTHARAQLGSQPRRANPAGARADDEQIVVVMSHLASGSCTAQRSHAASAGHDSQIGEPKEQAVLHHARNALPVSYTHLTLGDAAKGAI